ncbi:MAG: hypothetical protein EXR62_03565 [Chloroflexi bacterium]|nr:hypothetical protein [Chloroflexota bacterium]
MQKSILLLILVMLVSGCRGASSTPRTVDNLVTQTPNTTTPKSIEARTATPLPITATTQPIQAVTKNSVPTPIPLTATINPPTLTPAPATATQIENKFNVGQEIYLVPPSASLGAPTLYYISMLSDDVGLFKKVSGCNDISGRKAVELSMYYGQKGHVTKTIPCQGTVYYFIDVAGVKEKSYMYRDWQGWVSETQLSSSLPSPMGLSFYLDIPADNNSYNYIPRDLLKSVGDQAKTQFNGQPATISLKSVDPGETRFATVFSITNNGAQDIKIRTNEIMTARRAFCCPTATALPSPLYPSNISRL